MPEIPDKVRKLLNAESLDDIKLGIELARNYVSNRELDNIIFKIYTSSMRRRDSYEKQEALWELYFNHNIDD